MSSATTCLPTRSHVHFPAALGMWGRWPTCWRGPRNSAGSPATVLRVQSSGTRGPLSHQSPSSLGRHCSVSTSLAQPWTRAEPRFPARVRAEPGWPIWERPHSRARSWGSMLGWGAPRRADRAEQLTSWRWELPISKEARWEVEAGPQHCPHRRRPGPRPRPGPS